VKQKRLNMKSMIPGILVGCLSIFAVVTVATGAVVAADSTTTHSRKTTKNLDGSTTTEDVTSTHTVTSKSETTTTTVPNAAPNTALDKAVSDNEKSSHDDFKAKVTAQLDALTAQIDVLKTQAATASSDASVKLKKRAHELEMKRDAINADLDLAQNKSGRAWTRFKSGVQKAVGDLSKGYDQAKNEFSKEEKKGVKRAEKAEKDHESK
jgi:hypothetical protein